MKYIKVKLKKSSGGFNAGEIYDATELAVGFWVMSGSDSRLIAKSDAEVVNE